MKYGDFKCIARKLKALKNSIFSGIVTSDWQNAVKDGGITDLKWF